MAQNQSPEFIYSKLVEFQNLNDDLQIVNFTIDYFLSNRKKVFSSFHETILEIFIKSAIKLRKFNEIKEALVFYRSVTTLKLESFVKTILQIKTLIQDQINKISKDVSCDNLSDLDSEDSPEKLLQASIIETDENSIKEEIFESLKFVWMMYKLLLDFTKVNNKLIDYYFSILKSTFTFCKNWNLKNEFKRLCDSVRGFIQTLLKSSKLTNVPNKIEINNSDIIKNLIFAKLEQLETAVKLKQWQEGFKTAEDVVFLIQKGNEYKLRLPSKINLDYYNSLSVLFSSCDYYLYFGICQIMMRRIFQKIERRMDENEKDILKNITSYVNLPILDRNIVLSYIKSFLNQKSFEKYGDEVSFDLTEREIDSNERIVSILRIKSYPSSEDLRLYIKSSSFNTEDKSILSLFNSFEEIVSIIELMKNSSTASGNSLLSSIRLFMKILNEDNSQESEKENLKKAVFILTIPYFHIIFNNITFTKISNIFNLSYSSIEELLLCESRKKKIKTHISHSKKLVFFKEITNDSLSRILYDFSTLFSITNESQIQIYKESLKKKLDSLSIASSDERLKQLNSILEEKNIQYINRFSEIDYKKDENREKEEKENEIKENEIKESKKREEEERMNKENDTKLKFFIINKLQEITTSVIIESGATRMKYKIQDLIKEHEKITSDELVQVYIEEKENFNQKTTAKLRVIEKKMDYEIRAIRKYDKELQYAKNILFREMIYKELDGLTNNQVNFRERLGNNYDLIMSWVQNNVYSQLQSSFDNYINVRTQYVIDKEKYIQDYIYKTVFPLSDDMKGQYEKEEAKKGVFNDNNKGLYNKTYVKRADNFKDNETSKPIKIERSINAPTIIQNPDISKQAPKEEAMRPTFIPSKKAEENQNVSTKENVIVSSDKQPIIARSVNAQIDEKPKFLNSKKEETIEKPPQFTNIIRSSQNSTVTLNNTSTSNMNIPKIERSKNAEVKEEKKEEKKEDKKEVKPQEFLRGKDFNRKK